MGWVMLAIAAAAVAGVVAALRSFGRGRRRSDMAAYRQHSRAERVERPSRRLAHFYTSGVPPRWDP